MFRSSNSRVSTVAPWALLVGSTLLFGSVSLVYPHGRDQTIYAFLGNALLHGMTLYKDIPIMLLPMTSILHALSQILFGHSEAAIRILDLLWALSTTCLLSLLVSRLFRRPWLGAVAGLIYSFTYFSIDFWNTAQVDGFLNLPLVASLYLVAVGLTTDSSQVLPGARKVREMRGVWLAAGLLMGTALLFKYTVGLLVPGVVSVIALAGGRPRVGFWRAAFWFCAGCLAAWLVAAAVMALSGALPSFVSLQVGTTIPYSRHRGAESFGWALNELFTWIPPKGLVFDTTPYLDATIPATLLGLVGLVPAVVILITERGRRNSRYLGPTFVLLWLTSVVLSLAAQGKFAHYHLLPSLPPLSVLGALAVAYLFRPLARMAASNGRRVALAAVVLVGLAFTTRYPTRFADLADVASDRSSLHDLWSREDFRYFDYSVAERVALTEYLRRHTSASDRVANLDPDVPATFPAWRQPVMRLARTNGVDPATWSLSDEFLTNPPDVFTIKRDEWLMPFRWYGSRDAYQRLMAFAFRRGEVVYWLPAGRRDGRQLLTAFTALRDLVRARYELEARVGHYDVLRLADSDSLMLFPADSLMLLKEDLDEALDWLKVRSASPHDSGFKSVSSILWPCRVPDRLDSVLTVKMMSHKTANRSLWMGDRKLDDFLPALSVWIADDKRPFACQDPFRQQGEREDYDAGGLSFRVRHRCRNGLVLVYDVRRAADFVGPVPSRREPTL